MRVIAIITSGEYYPVAIVKMTEILDSQFEIEIKKLHAWKTVSEEEMMAAQTFVTWLRKKSSYNKYTLQQLLENEEYAWSGPLTIQDVGHVYTPI